MSGRSKWPFSPGFKGGGGPDSAEPSRKIPTAGRKRSSCHSPPTSLQAPTQKQPRLELDDQDLAREVELSDLDETETVDDQDPFKTFKGETAEDYFQRILENSPKAQIYLEYLNEIMDMVIRISIFQRPLWKQLIGHSKKDVSLPLPS